jgi:ribosomal protein L37AE/L43A
VAYALYARCDSIVTVTEAVRGRFRCPRCADICDRIDMRTGVSADHVLRCSRCSWEMTVGAYRKSYRDRRLFGGGAEEAFRDYVARFPHVRTPQEKMLLIDRLIHAIHNELADRPQRPAAVNLIDGDVRSVVALLEGLAYGNGSTPGTVDIKAVWRSTREAQAAGPRRRRGTENKL